MKKLLALLLTLTMVLGMTMTANAEEAHKPVAGDTASVTVENVEINATVTAYQIIAGDYGTNGFLGYKQVEPTKGDLNLFAITETDPYLDGEDELPTSTQVTEIARQINAGTLEVPSVELDEAAAAEGAEVTSYTEQLSAGYWVILVRGTVQVYNPMLVGVYYDVNETGDNNELGDAGVDAEDDWTLVTNGAYAKSSDIPFEKTADVQTQNVGGEVVYTIETQIPDYSTEYTDAKFEVKDTFTNLTLVKDSIEVTIDGAKVTESTGIYTITGNEEDSTTFTVAFAPAWLLARENNGETAANAGKPVVITYKGILGEDAVNTAAGTNKAELFYTNNPGEDEGYDEDTEKVYSFDIDGTVTKRVITKVKEDNSEGAADDATLPLAGATFKLYKDAVCTEEYSNTSEIDGLTSDGVVSDAEGQLHISGLNVGTYYLKETKAPIGYSLNDTVYKIDITAEIDENDELQSWEIKVTNMTTGEDVTNDFTVSNGVASANQGTINETPIMNIKLIALPSTGGIGTTIFTIAGCGIMIAAAFFFFVSRRKEA